MINENIINYNQIYITIIILYITSVYCKIALNVIEADLSKD